MEEYPVVLSPAISLSALYPKELDSDLCRDLPPVMSIVLFTVMAKHKMIRSNKGWSAISLDIRTQCLNSAAEKYLIRGQTGYIKYKICYNSHFLKKDIHKCKKKRWKN